MAFGLLSGNLMGSPQSLQSALQPQGGLLQRLLGSGLVGTGQYVTGDTLDGKRRGEIMNPGSGLGQRLRDLLSPEIALPMAGAMMSARTPQAGFGKAMELGGLGLGDLKKERISARDKQRTMEYLTKAHPDLAQAIDMGLPVGEAWKTALARDGGNGPKDLINAGGGNLYDPNLQKWITAPGGGGGTPPSSVQEFEYGQKNPEYMEFMKSGKGRDSSLTVADKKAIFEAEDNLPAIEGTISALDRAKELNDKTYTGYTAGARGWAGANLPGAGMVLDEQTSKDTVEFNNLMTYESIKTMADTLKGATTDFELNKFVEILADPATPPDVRKRTIERMITLANRKKQVAEERVRGLRAGDYYDAPAASGGTVSPTPDGGGWTVKKVSP